MNSMVLKGGSHSEALFLHYYYLQAINPSQAGGRRTDEQTYKRKTNLHRASKKSDHDQSSAD